MGQMYTILSLPPLAKYFPSGDQVRPQTSWVCPPKVKMWWSATLTSCWWIKPDLEPLWRTSIVLNTSNAYNLQSERRCWPYLDKTWSFQLKQPTLAEWPSMLRRRFWYWTSHNCKKWNGALRNSAGKMAICRTIYWFKLQSLHNIHHEKLITDRHKLGSQYNSDSTKGLQKTGHKDNLNAKRN